MFNAILPFITLILVVVFIHEYGHYYFAKKYGVGVTDFSIGFGKEIFGWNDKSGTRWKICWIPLGGYVKFFGDRNVFSQADQEKIINKYSTEDQKKLFVLKPLYQRAIIVAAGPFANFLLAIVIFLSIYMFIGKDFTPAMINEVQNESPAQVAGLKKNDVILEIDGNKVKSILDVSKLIMMSTSEFIDFKVSRFENELILKVKPNVVDVEDNMGNKVKKRMVGIKLSPFNNEIKIPYKINSNDIISAKIFNIKGQSVLELYNGKKKAGNHYLNWNGLNNLGQEVPSGTYVLVVDNEQKIYTQKLLLLK